MVEGFTCICTTRKVIGFFPSKHYLAILIRYLEGNSLKKAVIRP